MQLRRLTTRLVNGVARRYPPLQAYLDRSTRVRFVRGGCVPMSEGYEEYKEDFIGGALRNPRLLERFRDGGVLPGKYGRGIDERCVEYLWLFSRLGSGRTRLLDAGSVLNHRYLLEQPTLADKKLHILTLAPEHAAFWQRGISYLYEDMRDIPVKDGLYDEVVCLSTLEHVGMDSSFYTGSSAHRERQPEDYSKALHELRRVLKPGGKFYLSVPYGRYRDIGVLQVFDAQLLQSAIQEFDPAEAVSTFYRYTADGWERSTAEACAGAEYVDAYFRYFMTPSEARPKDRPRESDLAAAARAVACVEMVRRA